MKDWKQKEQEKSLQPGLQGGLLAAVAIASVLLTLAALAWAVMVLIH